MNKAIFDYNGKKYTIQCDKEDIIEDIIGKFLSKSGKSKNKLSFLYKGQPIDEELTFNECLDDEDEDTNSIRILVNEKDDSDPEDEEDEDDLSDPEGVSMDDFEDEININNISYGNNFKLNELKELQTYTPNNEVEQLLVLNDGRILTSQCFLDEDEESNYKLCVYSIKNNKFICQINLDYDGIGEMYLMKDGYIIIKTYARELKIISITNDKIKEIWKLEKKTGETIKRLSENMFLIPVDNGKKISGFFSNIVFSDEMLYTYKNGKLALYKDVKQLYKSEKINNICHLKQDEFAIYINKKALLCGTKDCLVFYNMRTDSIIKTLKVGKGENSYEMFLINNDNLLISGDRTTKLIDVKNRKFLKEFIFEMLECPPIILNSSLILSYRSHFIQLYEFDNLKTIKLKEEKKIRVGLVEKYPGNKLIIYSEKKLIIFG